MNSFIAVVGCGYWGRNLVRNFHALGALGAVCDTAESGRMAATELAPDVPVTDSLVSVLANPAITAIAIAAPAASHYALVRDAFEARKDVFVEKPLCLKVEEATELVALGETRQRVLMVGHLLQYHPCIQRLQALLATGELGKLHYVISNRLNLGKIRREENALWSFAPHDISVILSLANGHLPETVLCSGGTYLNDGIADTTLTVLTFPGGMHAHAFVSWLNPFKEQKLTVVGSAGMAVFDDTKPWPEKLLVFRQYLVWQHGEIPTPNEAHGEAIAVAASEPLRNECQHFIDCCMERRIPRTDGREGLRVLRVLHAAQQSLDHQSHVVVTASVGARPRNPDYFAHPTAVIDEGARIGRGTKIWHFSHVMKGAQIGLGCILGQNVNVDAGAMLGNNVKVQNNVSIYSGVVVEDDVFLGPSCVLTNVTNPRAQVNRHSLYEGTTVRRGATIGANATIVCGVTIGRYAFVGAGAVVTKDVPDYGLVVGNPAKLAGWMSRHGHRLVPTGSGPMQCPESGLHYHFAAPGQLVCDELDEDAPLPANLARGKRRYDEYKIQPATSPLRTVDGPASVASCVDAVPVRAS